MQLLQFSVLMTASYFLFTKSGGDKLARNAIGGMTGQKVLPGENQQSSLKQQDTANNLQNLYVECRKGLNIEKPECVKWFDQITKSGASVATGDSRQTTVSYNPSEPFNDDIQKQVSYEVTAKPVFSGCMKTGSKYQAYTQQGTKLDVSQADCQRLIENNDRPFDYFANNRSDMSSTEMQRSEISTQTNQPTL